MQHQDNATYTSANDFNPGLFDFKELSSLNTRYETTSAPTYVSAQHFVEAQYSKAYDAHISCDFPNLFTVLDDHEAIMAVAGFRTPNQPFFLEHYLDCSAEQALSEKFGCTVERKKIFEIGNLAGSGDRFATEYLKQQLWDHVVRGGYEYMILTGTQALLRTFRDWNLQYLAEAEADMIPDAAKWGTYYQHSPRVVAGRLLDCKFKHLPSEVVPCFHSELLSCREVS